MQTRADGELTLLLRSVNAGEAGAQDRLAERIYGDLRAMARRRLRSGGAGGAGGLTIQPTMLASDTLMKLISQRQRFDNSGHLFAIASRMMMRLLIDYHRQRQAAKRGGAAGGKGPLRVPLDPDQPAPQTENEIDVESLSAALNRLAELDARKADVVKYRVLWGFTTKQIAEQLDASVATIERDWAFAKTWLAKELAEHA